MLAIIAFTFCAIGFVIPLVDGIPMEVVGQLPTPRSGTVVVFDEYDYGRDFYIIGGERDGLRSTNEVLIFQQNYPSRGTQVMTRLPPPRTEDNIALGFGFIDPNTRNVYYIGGFYFWANNFRSSKHIWRISSTTNDFSVVQTFNLTQGQAYASALWVQEKKAAYIIGARSWKYFPENGTVEDLEIGQSFEHSTSVYDGNYNIYIFGGLFYENRIWTYNIQTEVVTLLQTKLQYPVYSARAIWNGNYAYIVSRFRDNQDKTGIQRFDPRTESSYLLDVQFPYNLNDFAVAWVNYSNQIYVFGGSIPGVGKSGDIMKVDLANL